MRGSAVLHTILSIILVATTETWTQENGHIPGCSDAHSGGGTTCWGYATARAFGRGWSHPTCPAGTQLQITNINYNYFTKYSFDVSQLQPGYLVGWGDQYQPNHVAYVSSTNGTFGGTYVAQVESEGSTTEHAGYTLTQVINGVPGDGVIARGNPTCYFVKRPRWSARATNSFAQGQVTVSGSSGSSPHTVSNLHWESQVVLYANEANTYWNPYWKRLRAWKKGTQVVGYSQQTYSDITKKDYTSPEDFVADLPSEFNVTFANSLPGWSGGDIKVDGQTLQAPATVPVLQDDETVGEAPYQVHDRVMYTYDQWSVSPSSNPRTFAPMGHVTYTASYNAKPLPPEYVTAGGTVGDYVHVTWSAHPHSCVQQYQIWRKRKPKNESEEDPVLVTTVSKPTTSFIDYEFIVTSGYTDDLVSYDVRSVFNAGGGNIYSDPSYVAVFAYWCKLPAPVLLSFAIQAFPNPFNPSTRILYSLKSPGMVRIAVVDALGREVATLANEYRTEGQYSVVWKGTNAHGQQVGSGAYFAQIVVTDDANRALYYDTIRLLLTK
jgi:hypothetical protein